MQMHGAAGAQTDTALEKNLRITRNVGLVLIIMLAIACSVTLNHAWRWLFAAEMQETLVLGETAGALMDPAAVLPLQPEADPANPQTAAVQQTLARLADANPDIRYAYLSVLDADGRPIVLMDSGERVTSGPSVVEGTDLWQAAILKAFAQRQTIRECSARGIWNWQPGTLTPIVNPADQSVIAVLGLRFQAGELYLATCKRIFPVLLLCMSVFLLSVAVLRIQMQNRSLRCFSVRLKEDEGLFHSVFDQAPVGISIGSDHLATYDSPRVQYSVNRMFEKILGRSHDELRKTNWMEITHPDDLAQDVALVTRFRDGEIPGYMMEKRFLRPDGSVVWTNMTIGKLSAIPNEQPMHLCILEDITHRKRIEEALLESERSKSVLLSHLPGLAYRCRYDRNWTMLFVSPGCEALTGYKPESLLNNHEVSYNDLIAPEYRELLWNEWERVLSQRTPFRHEYEILTCGGTRKWVLEMGQFILDDNGKPEAMEGLVIDISEQKRREAQVQYMSEHDFLTGLYNRNRLDQEKTRLEAEDCAPLTVAICDINGVRLINNGFGAAEGDRLIADVALMLKQNFRQRDILCRTGGDEFTLLLPDTKEEQAAALLEQLFYRVEQYNRGDRAHHYELNLSIGLSTRTNTEQGIEQLITVAEEHLNHRKLLNQKSSHNAILASIMAALYARSHETEEHGKRLTCLTRMIGESMGLDVNMLDDLMLLSMLHDIGKVGVDDRILNKPGALEADEWELMQKHSEIGYRITRSTPELEHIAEYILHHHERWDGKGYPARLAGEQIPLPARILTVADAYDAMTQDRVYRRAIPGEEALGEIERCAGTQFDPSVVEVFLRGMRQTSAQTV
ncbi:MAG: PAS domain S-box protein [Candidatus Limiplasma sp.]|nr:PAS domain S-box protein [Candidatus Limiplasma sp.]